jgi:hypothetical protein
MGLRHWQILKSDKKINKKCTDDGVVAAQPGFVGAHQVQDDGLSINRGDEADELAAAGDEGRSIVRRRRRRTYGITP